MGHPARIKKEQVIALYCSIHLLGAADNIPCPRCPDYLINLFCQECIEMGIVFIQKQYFRVVDKGCCKRDKYFFPAG